MSQLWAKQFGLKSLVNVPHEEGQDGILLDYSVKKTTLRKVKLAAEIASIGLTDFRKYWPR
jgi:hypothetical protein